MDKMTRLELLCWQVSIRTLATILAELRERQTNPMQAHRHRQLDRMVKTADLIYQRRV